MKLGALLLLLGVLVSCGISSVVTPTASELINQYNKILQCKGLSPIGTITQEQLNSIAVGCSDLDKIAVKTRFTCLEGTLCGKNGQTCAPAQISASCQSVLAKFTSGSGGEVNPNNLDVD